MHMYHTIKLTIPQAERALETWGTGDDLGVELPQFTRATYAREGRAEDDIAAIYELTEKDWNAILADVESYRRACEPATKKTTAAAQPGKSSRATLRNRLPGLLPSASYVKCVIDTIPRWTVKGWSYGRNVFAFIDGLLYSTFILLIHA
jgi:hypothetical protein